METPSSSSEDSPQTKGPFDEWWRRRVLLTKEGKEDEGTFGHSCCLCSGRPGDEHLSLFCSPVPGRVEHLRSLLGSEEVALVCCTECREKVTKLFSLREEVDKVENNIRNVVMIKKREQRELETMETQVLQDVETQAKGDETSVSVDGRMTGESDDASSSVPRTVTLQPITEEKEDNHGNATNTPREEGRMDVRSWLLRAGSHFRSTPTPVIPKWTIVCPTCKRRFWNKSTYRAHKHLDEKDPTKICYICEICNKTLTLKKRYHSHKKLTHGLIGDTNPSHT